MRVDNCGCINSKVTINIYLPTILKIGLRDLYVTHLTTAPLIRAIGMKTLPKTAVILKVLRAYQNQPLSRPWVG